MLLNATKQTGRDWRQFPKSGPRCRIAVISMDMSKKEHVMERMSRAGTIQIQIQIFSRFEGFKDNYLHLYSYIKKIHFKINLQNLIQRYKHLKINLNDLIKWQIHLKTDLHNLIQQENFGLQTCCFTKIIHLRYYVFGYFS